MAKIITIANQKGGVAKTTTTGALAAGLKMRGNNVLGIDFDPQGNLSSSIGIDAYNCSTVYQMLLKKDKANDVIQKTNSFDIIPSNIILAGIEHELIQTGKEYRLEETLQPVINDYDYIIIDTPPSLGILTTNAIMAADELIIPSTAGIFAATGIQQLKLYIDSITPYRKRPVNLKIDGILITKYNPRAIINRGMKEFTEQLANIINTKVYNTYIRFSVSVEEAQAEKSDLYNYSNSSVSEDYNNFLDEYLNNKK
jgi:ATPases involved in chromosome partitioning